jgi:pimeloyl-ACP methyl ester carboxylesterase
MSEVEEVRLPVGNVVLSGLYVAPEGTPRATILALHGGGMRASYFHGSAHPDLSLLRLGASLGYQVLALDRPGYGASTGLGLPGASIAGQASLCLEAIDVFSSGRDIGAGWGMVAHSYGMKVAIAMAASSRRPDLVGLDCSGAGIRFNPEVISQLGRSDGSPDRRELFWGPEHLYPPKTFERGSLALTAVPAVESEEAPRWPEEFPGYASLVRIPVRYTVAEYERWWEVHPAALQEFRASFAGAPRVQIDSQPGAGHNISLGWSARPYHLRALAFIDECATAHLTPRMG